MSKEMANAIKNALQEAIDHEKGLITLRTTTMKLPKPAPKWTRAQIARLRTNVFSVSQTIFAAILSVAPATIRSWEQGLKKPSGTANRLLQILSESPETLSQIFNQSS